MTAPRKVLFLGGPLDGRVLDIGPCSQISVCAGWSDRATYKIQRFSLRVEGGWLIASFGLQDGCEPTDLHRLTHHTTNHGEFTPLVTIPPEKGQKG